MSASLYWQPEDPAVYQATGMLSVQLDTPVAEAETWLHDYARRAGKPVAEVAQEIVARQLQFQYRHGCWPEIEGAPDSSKSSA